MKRDLIIGIVGALILVAAMVGVFRYEAGRAGTAFDVDWTTEMTAGPSTTGETAEGAQTETTLNVTAANLTSLTFALTWTDDVGEPDEFELTVVSPEGESRTVAGTTGTLEVTFGNLSAVPPPTRVQGANESDARARLAAANTGNAGTGTWSLILRLVNAGDATAPVVGVPVTEDTGNAWTLEARQEVYAPQLSRP